MKKLLFLVFSMIFILFMSGNALAVTYDLGSGLENGGWVEVFHGGGPGQVGNELRARSLDNLPPAFQWGLQSCLLQDVQIVGTSIYNTPIYETVYENGVLVLNDVLSPWGIVTPIPGASAVNTNWYDQAGNLYYNLSLSAAMVGYEFDVYAEFIGEVDVNYYPNLPAGHETQSGYVLPAPGHGGMGFETLELTVVPEPATMLLLGSGLIGLAGFRRKFKKK